MLNQVKELLKQAWIKYLLLPITLSLALAFMVAPAHPAPPTPGNQAKTPPAAQSDSRQETQTAPQTGSSTEVQELKKTIEELQKSALDQRASILESGRKTIDWWFAFLAVFGAVLALAGVFLPYLMTRKYKEEIEKDLESVKELKKETEQEIEKFREETKNALLEFHKKEEEAFQNYRAGTQVSSEQNNKLQEELEKIQSDPASDYKLKLRAEAITASVKDDAQMAYASWNALSLLAPTDALAALNAGYWASKLADRQTGDERIRWLKQAGTHYQIALDRKPDLHDAANNWGIALSKEADVLAKTDPTTARALWQHAADKYQEALRIKSDFHNAAYNWGNALDDEAQALANTDLPAARALWQQAADKYQQALRIKPDYHEAANNWGSALIKEADAVANTDPTAARALWQQARAKCQQALRIKPDLHEAANNWGVALANEARVLAKTDLPAARALWQQAADKYQQALRIKPDFPNAANNWGSALDDEAQALANSDLPAARALWQQAADKYQQALRIKPDKHEAANNWGNALSDEAQALANSDLTAARALWQQAAAKYQQALRIKPDDHDTAHNWGITLLHEAKAIETEEPDRAQALRTQAETLLLEHAQAAPGLVAYNLACVYALRKDVENSLKWLETSRQHQTLEDCLHLRTDSDLDAIRQHPDFAAWLQSVCPQGDTAS